MAKKESSNELSSLASQILSGNKKPTVQDAKRLAASVLSQDETPGRRSDELNTSPLVAAIISNQSGPQGTLSNFLLNSAKQDTDKFGTMLTRGLMKK